MTRPVPSGGCRGTRAWVQLVLNTGSGGENKAGADAQVVDATVHVLVGNSRHSEATTEAWRPSVALSNPVSALFGVRLQKGSICMPRRVR